MQTGAQAVLPYRPEIDGLRAFAVLAVIAHHVWPRQLPGGYIGVDVFFVISGYLIGRLVLDAIQHERFSLIDFWGRRAKRLLPALLLVLCVSAILADDLLNAFERRQFWASMGSAALSVSNFFFWRHTDYFAPEAAHAPLLHTWSLGVEEQFYLLFPLVALLLHRRQHLRRRLHWVLLCLSLSLAALLWHWRPIAAFYLLPSRLFELLAGIALVATRAKEPGAPAKHTLCALAVLLLLAQLPVAPESGFGRFAQISVAVACTAGLITWADTSGPVGRLLTSAPALKIGRASYSLYLWHLPALALGPLLLPTVPTSVLALIGLVAGGISHRVLEQPLRQARWLPPRMALVSCIGLSVACAGYAALRYSWHGLSHPPSADQRALLDYRYDYATDYELGSCFIGPAMAVAQLRSCPIVQGTNSTKPTRLLLWGDSHAAHLFPGLLRQQERPFSLFRWAVAGCAPLPGISSRHRQDCAAINEALLARVATLHPDIVVLAADWMAMEAVDFAPIVTRLRSMNVQRIIVVGPVPTWQQPLPYQLIEHGTRLETMPVRLQAGLDLRGRPLDAQLARQSASLNLEYLSALDVFCDDAGCLTRATPASSELSSWDQAHLRPFASRRLADALIALIKARPAD